MKALLKFDLEEATWDQRMDLTLATEQRLKNDLFLASIAEDMVLLSWTNNLLKNNQKKIAKILTKTPR